MSEKEIKALAAELGLDANNLHLFEPYRFMWNTRRYGFQYTTPKKQFDYSFLINEEDIRNGVPLEEAVRFYVNKGLRELAQAVNGQV